MKKTLAATAVTAAGTALARTVATRRRQSAGTAPAPGNRAHREADPGRWRCVTVLRRIDELRGTIPAPLADFAAALEVDVRSAPDGKGTEIAARWRDAPSGRRPAKAAHAVEELRAALRRTKQELEIGWQVTPTRSPVDPTPLNRPLREADRHAFGGGVR